MLDAAREGAHALLAAATGAGKTLAGFLPTIIDLIEDPTEGLHTLYISPLKALAVDVQRNLLTPVEEMDLDVRVETRTGDTPSDRKARQRVRPPQILLTTPESLSLLLSYPDSSLMFENLKTVVIDEIHAFARDKRGDLLSLGLSRLQALSPGLRRVGLSATVAEPLRQDFDKLISEIEARQPAPDPAGSTAAGTGTTEEQLNAARIHIGTLQQAVIAALAARAEAEAQLETLWRDSRAEIETLKAGQGSDDPPAGAAGAVAVDDCHQPGPPDRASQRPAASGR